MCYLCSMDRVGISLPRRTLAVFQRRLNAGRSLDAAERDEAVAAHRARDHEEAIARLEARRLVLRRPSRDLATVRPLRLEVERPLSELLDEMRQDTV